MKMPNRIFFSGAPGSKWSGIAQILESTLELNISDRTPAREYTHGKYSGHKGAYFGNGMEFETKLLPEYLDGAWVDPTAGCKIVKSHDWVYQLPQIKEKFPNDWIMLVYRPTESSFNWWKEAGGFDISYPSYAWYENDEKMKKEIAAQNEEMLKFTHSVNAKWQHFSSSWVNETFDTRCEFAYPTYDILVTVIK
jgi:hypothetical protein